MRKIVDLLLAGQKLTDKEMNKIMDDAIDAWHKSKTAQPIETYLEMSAEEYSAFVKNPKNISKMAQEKADFYRNGTFYGI